MLTLIGSEYKDYILKECKRISISSGSIHELHVNKSIIFIQHISGRFYNADLNDASLSIGWGNPPIFIKYNPTLELNYYEFLYNDVIYIKAPSCPGNINIKVAIYG